MLTLSKGKVPFKTPIRRLLRRAAAIVGKQRTDSVHLSSLGASPISVTPETPRRSALTNGSGYRIALLTEVSVDNVIIVSALAAAPFCCHADLLTMSTSQLTAVARVLNDALPPSLRINVGTGCQLGDMRAEIEVVVGLRSPRPATLARPLSRFQRESPIAYQGQANDIPFFEDMNDDGDIGMSSSPPLKRRHFSPKPFPRTAYGPASQASPSPVVLGGSLAHSVVDTDMGPGTPKSFLTTSRPPYRVGQGPPQMSTPVKGTQTNCELTFGLEGFTVEGSSESGFGSLHAVDVSP